MHWIGLTYGIALFEGLYLGLRPVGPAAAATSGTTRRKRKPPEQRRTK